MPTQIELIEVDLGTISVDIYSYWFSYHFELLIIDNMILVIHYLCWFTRTFVKSRDLKSIFKY